MLRRALFILVGILGGVKGSAQVEAGLLFSYNYGEIKVNQPFDEGLMQKVRGTVMYLVLPLSQKDKKEQYLKESKENWPLNTIRVIGFDERKLLDTLQGICVAEVGSIWDKERHFRTDGHHVDIVDSRLLLNFTYYPGKVANAEEYIHFGRVYLLPEIQDEYRDVKTTDQVTYFANTGAILHNMTPGFFGLHLRMIARLLQDKKTIDRVAWDTLNNEEMIKKLAGDTLAVTEHALTRYSYTLRKKMLSPGKVLGSYEHPVRVLSYREMDSLLLIGQAPPFLSYPVYFNNVMSNYLGVVDTRSGEIIYGKILRRNPPTPYIDKKEYAILSRTVSKLSGKK